MATVIHFNTFFGEEAEEKKLDLLKKTPHGIFQKNKLMQKKWSHLRKKQGSN